MIHCGNTDQTLNMSESLSPSTKMKLKWLLWWNPVNQWQLTYESEATVKRVSQLIIYIWHLQNFNVWWLLVNNKKAQCRRICRSHTRYADKDKTKWWWDASLQALSKHSVTLCAFMKSQCRIMQLTIHNSDAIIYNKLWMLHYKT